MALQVQVVTDRATWHEKIAQLPQTHVLQTWDWGVFKLETTGWQPERILFLDGENIIAAASLLMRTIGPFHLMYIPKGPLFNTNNLAQIESVLQWLEQKSKRAIWVKIDPDVVLGTGLPPEAEPEDDAPPLPNAFGEAFQAMLQRRKWRFSDDQIQFRNTLTLDLAQGEDDLLAAMSQSTRRKIRQAAKKEVTVRETTDVDDMRALYDLYQTTGSRQGFIIRPWDYYHDLWTGFIAAGLAHVFVAEYDGQILSGAVVFHFGNRAWYFYGMSSNEERDRQPNYALQWHIIRWAKAAGYSIYDWWGAPNDFDENDSMWGVYRFKRGFGSTIVRTLGAWDYTPYPLLYWLYTQAAPRFIGILKRIRR